ncbi:MAG: hypothetical protein KAT71_03435, partial [Gammaproteobacteria bacterium]|nr:hypothetical protein [Gammaproteobacteria bacterium]
FAAGHLAPTKRLENRVKEHAEQIVKSISSGILICEIQKAITRKQLFNWSEWMIRFELLPKIFPTLDQYWQDPIFQKICKIEFTKPVVTVPESTTAAITLYLLPSLLTKLQAQSSTNDLCAVVTGVISGFLGEQNKFHHFYVEALARNYYLYEEQRAAVSDSNMITTTYRP